MTVEPPRVPSAMPIPTKSGVFVPVCGSDGIVVVVEPPGDVEVVVELPPPVVVVDVELSQRGVVMTFSSRVTAPLPARRRPLIVAPV